MNYSIFYYSVCALYMLLIFISVLKQGTWKNIILVKNRFKLSLLFMLISIIGMMFLCDVNRHCNGTYCLFFVGFVPFLILYYVIHLVTKTVKGLKGLFKGEKFDEMLSVFFLFPYIPTFITIIKIIIKGELLFAIHEHESHIFIVTMFLLLDLSSSFTEDSEKTIKHSKNQQIK